MTDIDKQSAKPAAKAHRNGGNKSPRRRAREFALQGLYQCRFGGQDEAVAEAHLGEASTFGKADREFFVGLLRGARAQEAELQELLGPYLDRPMDELSPIEACILLLGALELRQFPETPYRVIINEAIELAKSFGGTDGHKFVNGVLDHLAAQLRPVEVAARQKQQQP